MAAFLLIIAFTVHAQRSAVSHKAVVVRQVAENQSCTSNCQSKEAWITIPHAVGDLLKGHIGARQVHDTPIDGIPMFPRKVIWAGRDEADLAREFDQHVQGNIVAYASAMTAWQAEYGLATATHDIVQRVTHRGRAKRVIVNVLTFDNGNYYYNGARVMPEDANAQAQILYVRAVPFSVTTGLPSAWNWPGRGTLAYELRGPTFAAGSGMRTIGVGSSYDEPFDYSGTPFDPDARLVCLVDKEKPGCGQRQPDVKTLLGLMDATYAVLDYHRRVKPAGIRYGSGYAPQLTARVTDRVATFACPNEPNGTYSQVFRYSMKVEHRIDRYLVFSDGRHYLIQSFRDVVTPAEAAIPGSSSIARTGEYPNLGTRFLHHVTRAFTDATAYAPNTVSLGSVQLNQAAYCCSPQASYSETRDCNTVNSGWIGTLTRTYSYSLATCSWGYSDDTSTCRPAPPPAPTCTLTQDAATTLSGTPFRLSWGSANGSSATLTVRVNSGSYAPVACYPGTLSGFCSPSPVIAGEHLYRFEVTGAGGTTPCQVLHTVQCPSGTSWNGSTCAPVDVCDNIAGTQTSPPAGTVQSGTSCLCTGGRSWNAATSSCECPAGSTWNGSACITPPPDACSNLPGYQSAPPPGTFQWGTMCICTAGRNWNSTTNQCECAAGFEWNGSSCVCTGGRIWNSTTARCECPSGTAWNGSSCVPVDVCDNISGNQSSPPSGTVQSGSSCVCTGGRNWSNASMQCECPWGTSWNGSFCAVIDVCDNIAGVQTSPPADTVRSGSSCYCTAGRSWNDATGRCECPAGTAWNGATCAVVRDECESINGAPDPTIQSSLPAGYWRAPGTRQCYSGDRFAEPNDNWALSCFGTASGYSSPVQPGPGDWGYDPSRLVLCNVSATGGSADYCLAYTRKEDAYGQFWGVTPVAPVVYPFGLVCLGSTSVTYFPGYVP